eukprot:1159306-Pelagomonas_calceolata.AAC.10
MLGKDWKQCMELSIFIIRATMLVSATEVAVMMKRQEGVQIDAEVLCQSGRASAFNPFTMKHRAHLGCVHSAFTPTALNHTHVDQVLAATTKTQLQFAPKYLPGVLPWK